MKIIGKNQWEILLLVLLAMVQMPAEAKGSWKEYAANAQEVRYVGRIDESVQGMVQYDWVGTYFETEFTGGTFEVKIADAGTTYYNVFIDGQWVRKFPVGQKDAQWLTLAKGLSKSKHTVRLQDARKANMAPLRFRGSAWLPKVC